MPQIGIDGAKGSDKRKIDMSTWRWRSGGHYQVRPTEWWQHPVEHSRIWCGGFDTNGRWPQVNSFV